MLVDGDGQFLGSVSGGCVENAVVESALASMRTGERVSLNLVCLTMTYCLLDLHVVVRFRF